jgi:aldehyde dehydrogenase (NAD+)
MDISAIVQQQKDFFKSQQTRDLNFRKSCLVRLRKEISQREKEILEALYKDFRKPEFEGVFSETAIILNELDLVLKNLGRWARPKPVASVLLTFPSSSRLYKEPLGTVLIIAPWNYPFHLVFSPLIGAVAAGNTAVIKPSEHTPNTGNIVNEIVSKVFEEKHVCVVEGDSVVAEKLLKECWDYIFFTGSIRIGKIVAQAASVHLTPLTLELGGKNPCIVDQTVNIRLAARRIVWGKFINGGQTCIAPDYILIHRSVKDDFVTAAREEIKIAYGDDPQQSPDYPRIINRNNFDGLQKMILGQNILTGGQTDGDDLYVSPTLIDNPGLESEAMKEEIFGPVLPIIDYSDENEIEKYILAYEKPLALYVFSGNRKFVKRMISKYSFGGGTINDTTVHFANHRIPFGGVGLSGIGAYHGKHSFETFSHAKGITKRYNWLDIPIRYAPYKGKLKMLKFFMKWFR